MGHNELLLREALRGRDRDDVVVGARTRTRLTESLGALDLELSKADLAAIEATVPADSVAGTRYDAAQMFFLDSEK